MMLFKGKKGQVLLYGLMAGIIAGLVICFIYSVAIKKDFPMIDDASLSLIDSSIEAEKALLYLDQSAKYTTGKTIYDLAKKGGCRYSVGDKYFGYNLWIPYGCYPDASSSKNSFRGIFRASLNNNYLSKYGSLVWPEYNYNFKDNQLVGTAPKPMQISITKKGSSLEIGKYLIKQDFKASLGDYDFSDYDKLRAKAEALARLCKKNVNPEACVNENKAGIFNGDGLALDECSIEEKEKKFYEFVDYFQSCAYSDSLNCECGNKPEEGVFDITQSGNDAMIVGSISKKSFSAYLRNLNLRGSSLTKIDSKTHLYRDGYGKITTSLSVTESCAYKPKSKFIFCVKSNKHSFYAYDADNGKTELRNVVYKFALDFTAYCSPDYVYSSGATATNIFADENPDTKCLNSPCSSYYSCLLPGGDACACPYPAYPSTTNACQGDCTPYCSTPQAPGSTFCKELSCSSYRNCRNIQASTPPACRCPTPSDANTNACERIFSTEEACPSCWCPGAWSESSCGGGGACEKTRVLKTRTCMPAGCGVEKECVDKAECECSLDTKDSTQCMGNPCSSYDSCAAASSCGCTAGNACEGAGGKLCKPFCESSDSTKTADANRDTKCLPGNCAQDYENCGPIADNSCVCAGGNPCNGACTMPTTS